MTRKKFTGLHKGPTPKRGSLWVCSQNDEDLRCRCHRDGNDVNHKRNADSPHGFLCKQWLEGAHDDAHNFFRGRTTICQKWPGDLKEKLVAFQQYVKKLCRENSYKLGQIGNVNESSVLCYPTRSWCFDMPRVSSVDEAGAQEVKVRTTVYKKQCVTVMLCTRAYSQRLVPYIIL